MKSSVGTPLLTRLMASFGHSTSHVGLLTGVQKTEPAAVPVLGIGMPTDTVVATLVMMSRQKDAEMEYAEKADAIVHARPIC